MALFDGAESKVADNERLLSHFESCFNLMVDSNWRTLKEISEIIKAPEATVSAMLRSFRRPKFGSHIVNRRPRGDRSNGLYEYQLIPNIRIEGER